MIQFRSTSATAVVPKRYDPGTFAFFSDLGLGEHITLFPGATVRVSCGVQFNADDDVGLLVSLNPKLGAYGMIMNTRVFKKEEDIVIDITNAGGKTAIHHGVSIAIASAIPILLLPAKNVPFGG